ncbi:uncharacterized protein DNG_07372 [Cephalotrichum gorgonifer]|uniref:Pyrroloquinoline quinone-dependent pyranose dehydrogenase beta-propeller domain-containing protein n=1 Tax=Cephalotrichum gorgonifer TaxID=2041049 RepID=A0AAE8N2A2_9PEZI|nr:uncharacterized protein DNG_07372 [Cephalotrichum gorgonifer]
MRYPQHTVASGWSFTKLAGGLQGVRTVIFDPLGNMLVSQARKGISVHTFGPDGCIASSSMLISSIALNHGLSLTPDGSTLYASSETNVWSWPYDPATQKVGQQKTVITGMATGIHSTRNVMVVPQQPNLVLVQVGSNSNLDMQSEQPATGRAIVKVFDMSAVPANGYNYNTGGEVFAYGLRNEIGFTADPNGKVWGVENSGDDITRDGVNIHIDNPAEKLNFLGDPVADRDQFFGYPTCFSIWDPAPFRGLTTGDHFALNSAGDASCNEQAIKPRLSFQAHSAPIANTFDANATNMYVTFHGSWDRQPPTGFKVVEIPFTQLESGKFDPVAAATSREGYKDIFSAANPGSCTANGLTMSNCFRLTAAAWDPAGRGLVVGSDNSAEGELYLLSRV